MPVAVGPIVPYNYPLSFYAFLQKTMLIANGGK